MGKDRTRREFVAGAVLLAGTCALGGATKAFAGESELLRPPGGQDEDAFLALCLKCDRCRSVCPQRCIETASVADGFLNARTPKLNFHEGRCDFCDKCIDVCPTGALVPFDPEADKIGVAVVDTDKCIAYTRGLCVVCKGSCDYDALVFDEAERPTINAELCNGCGACVLACNVNVNRAFDGTFDHAIEVKLS